MAEDTIDLVMGWCAAEATNPEIVDAAKLPDAAEWAVLAHPAKDRTITIVQRKGVADRIEVNGGLRIVDAHAATFKALDIGQKARFLYSLRRDLMLLGVGYQGLGDPLVKVGFTRRVYVDDLMQTSFMAAFNAVQSALILVRGFVQIQLVGPGDPDTGAADSEPDGPFGDYLSGLDLSDI